MGKVIEIGNQVEERRRNVMTGVMALLMIDEWTGLDLFGMDEVSEVIMPAIDNALTKLMDEGTDILEIEDQIQEVREKFIEFITKEDVID